ncbi:tetratricopeptide repeat protein [Nitrospina gracilis]|uniref:tetratricopeptide repeat protein n=1 Tax=Nitrospina gracilis TaxID=35801 RepID=UPI001F35B237|nr:tetratricopeptide repeat protein [Nitrospina gracilis]MCF8721116.1 TPR repeat protein [Nitrospina gracilis Nb-211]
MFLDYLPNPFRPKADYNAAVTAYTSGDFKTAMAHFKTLAKRGNAEAMWYVADMYRYGRGVERDLQTAVDWFRKAADKNQPWALFEIGWFYKNGTGGYKRDSHTALEWFEKSGKGGYALGQYYAAKAYMEGIGTEKDLNKAREWLILAADQSHIDSQAILGDMYYHGKSVAIDDKKAHTYLQPAAERGQPLAQMDLAMMYENGDVVKRDLVQAYQWYSLAAAKGNKDAQRSLEFITPRIKTSEKQKADSWVASWKPRS